MFDSLGKCVLDSREVLFVEVILYELYDEGGFAWLEERFSKSSA
jgi:hypothetical protein